MTGQAVVIGAGRMAGGFLAPLLSDAGWRVTLASRTPAVVDALNESNGVRVREGACERWVGGVRGVLLASQALDRLVVDCDLLVTSTGPSALGAVAG